MPNISAIPRRADEIRGREYSELKVLATKYHRRSGWKNSFPTTFFADWEKLFRPLQGYVVREATGTQGVALGL